MVRTDPMIMAIGNGDIFLDFRYELYVDPNFTTMDMRGAHAINDGGYHNWVLFTIAGSKEETAATAVEERWGSTMESVSKDAERCFGMLKTRFAILHVPSNLHRARSIDPIVKVT
jgi:hypothetical protein